MTTALAESRVHHIELLPWGFSLTVEWDPDPALAWDAHWQAWLNGPGVRHRLQAYPAYTDTRRYLTKLHPVIKEVINEYRPLDL
jgi:hypothetical protein